MEQIQEWVLVKYGSAQESFELRTRALQKLTQGKVRIQVSAFGLNYADVMARKGMYKPAPSPPGVLGYEVSGIVKEVYDEKDAHWLNKRVLAFTRFGGYANTLDLSPEQLVEIPESLSFNMSTALATQYCTAYHMVHGYGQVQEGNVVFQHAASGGVGKAITDILKPLHVRLFGITGSVEKKLALQQDGFEEVFLRSNKQYHKQMRQLVPDGVDLVFNSVAGVTLKKDVKMMGSGGKLFIYGAAQRSGYQKGRIGLLRLVWNSGFLSPLPLAMDSKSLIGINMLALADKNPALLKNTMLQLVEMFKNDQIYPIVRAFPSNELPMAHELLEFGNSLGKLCVEW